MICPKCKAQLPAGAISCQKCGTKFKTKVCPHCKAVILAGAQVCPKCGRALSSQAQGAKSKWKKPLTKRWWFWAACAFLVIGIIGNIGNAAKSGKPAPSPSSAAASESIESNPFLAAETQEADVMNGTKTAKIGTWAYIEMKKASAKAASPEEYVEFARQRVSGQGYNWFSVLFEDGTGIQFTGCHTYLATYGQLDEEGCMVQPEGDVTLNTKTGACSYDLRKASPTPSPEPTEVPTSTPAPTPAATKAPASQEASAPASAAEENSSGSDSNTNSNANAETPPSAPVEKPNTPATAPQSPNDGTTIYITPTGKRYHYDSSCNGGTYIESTLEEALRRGLTPCNKCVN